ncbi:type IV pilus modification PilV family protein [Nocardioides halotolerans]|jgi:type II secretory pathway pseudopilin PulG|uniref:type IV pilus modification PilV family protein n=1 Tax=Nocardioides halotolerans TaxID=433660 RepID=UPI0004287E36|nr:type II secretion system protein [Nocardioides halotolerans]
MRRLARLRSAGRSDDGATLVETLVAVVILGIAAVAILGGLQLSVMASDIHRKQTSDGALVRGYAEAIEQHLDVTANYVRCAGANAYSPAVVGYPVPAGHTAQQAAAQPLSGDGSVATSGTCPTRDQGVQRLRLTVSSADGRAVETLTVVVRRSCGSGSSCD